jgi:hypothetical protein
MYCSAYSVKEGISMTSFFLWLDSWPLIAVIGFFVAVYVALEAISMWRK